MMNTNFLLPFVLLMLFFQVSSAQEPSADDLFTQAREAAFERKDYQAAIALSKKAVLKNPNYDEIHVFLGRLYTWSSQPDSARAVLSAVLNRQPDYADASLALASLEFWEGNSETALQHVDAALKYNSNAKDLLLLKAKVLNDLKRWPEANTEIDKVLKIDPDMTEARTLSSRIRENSSANRVGITYDFVYFDKQFDNPWHLLSLDYSRQTSLGSITGRINYANRFATSGIQFEVDAYPRLSKTFQAYISGGYSNNVGVFPKYRAGFSLYANLPSSFEAEAGFRYLTFGDPTWIYTASVGKYYKSYWFNFRTFLTPSNDAVSQSFALTARYYYGGADDYFSIRLGTGLSPDDPQNNILIGSANYKLRSNNATIGYRKAFKSLNVLSVNLGIDNQEYQPGTRGNQIDIGIGYIRRF